MDSIKSKIGKSNCTVTKHKHIIKLTTCLQLVPVVHSLQFLELQEMFNQTAATQVTNFYQAGVAGQELPRGRGKSQLQHTLVIILQPKQEFKFTTLQRRLQSITWSIMQLKNKGKTDFIILYSIVLYYILYSIKLHSNYTANYNK